MLAIQTVLIGSVIGIIIAFIMYQNGYKRQGIDLFRGIIGADLMYTFLVLAIGLAPASMG